MKKSPFFSASLSVILLAAFAASAQSIYQLQPLSGFGSHGDGSVRLGEINTLDNASNQRGMAYDPGLTNLVLVDTHSGAGGSKDVMGNIFILNALTGGNVDDGFGGSFKLNTNGMPHVEANQAYADAPAAVADDGVVYVCNQVNDSTTTPFIIFRWDSSLSTNPPVMAFSNNITPRQRYGTSIAIRGAGTGTQILIGSLASSSTGTNVVIFTTTDGTNFTANVLGADVTNPNFNDGVAFGAGDTFWAKQIGSTLRCFSFNIGAHTATTIKSFDVTTFPDNPNLGPIAVNTNLNLLAAVEELGGTVSGGPDRVRLYDISNFSNQPPVLLDVKSFVPDNQNTTAPMGFMDFKGTNLYVHVSNNGLMGFGVGLATPPAPTLTTVPAATNQTIVGRTVSLTVAGFPAVSYQWQSNNVDIANATNGTLSLANVQTSFSAVYTCIVTNSGGSTNASTTLVVVSSASFYHLNLQWTAYPGDGFDGVGAKHSYINTNGAAGAGTPNLRCVAYNPLSNHLYAITRSSATTSNYTFNVIDASTGNFLYTLSTNNMSNGYSNSLAVGSGGIGLSSVVVSDDGSIYACNIAPQAGGGADGNVGKLFRIWRWADGNSNTTPVQIYVGDPAIIAGIAGSSSSNRWGDSLAIRGSGTNTQLILDNNDNPPKARYVAILTPTDSTLTTWNTAGLHQTSTGSTIGRSLEFGDGGTTTSGTFWQKRHATGLIQSSFDLVNPIDPVPALITTTAFTNALSGGTVDANRHLFLAVANYGNTVTPDTLDMYEVSDFNSPFLLAQYNFPVNFGTNHVLNNANCIGQTIRRGDKVFTLNANNGLMAFNIAAGAPTAPVFLTQPRDARVIQGGTVAFTVTTDQQAAFQWRLNNVNISGATSATYTLAAAQFTDAGQYRAVASNIFGVSTSAVANLTVVSPTNTYSMAPIWSNAIGSQPYLKLDTSANGTSPFIRGLAYSATANQLYLASRTNTQTGLLVNVLDPNTGAKLYELSTSGIAVSSDPPRSTDNIILSMMGVSDDGAIYAGNISMANNTTTNAEFHLYRWADSNSNTVPVLVYSGEPANAGPGTSLRWGDTMYVRGSGTNTEIIIDNQRNAQAVAAVLAPTDATMTVFTNRPFAHGYGTLPIGRSVQFGSTNTVWQKGYGSSLKLSQYSLATQTSSVLTNFDTFSGAVGGLFMDLNRNLAVGVEFASTFNTTPDKLNFYEISDFNTPLLIAKFNFPTNSQNNDNHVSHAVFTPTKVFALDSNNGLLAFSLAPQLTITPQPPNVVLSWITNFVGFTVQCNPSVSSGTWTNLGQGTIVGNQYFLTNSVGAGNAFYRLAR